jgi:hypothetical protein
MLSADPGLPPARGPLSEAIIHLLRTGRQLCRLPKAWDDPLSGDDSNLALYLCYEMHYRGFDGVSDHLEWDPAVLTIRSELERRFEERLLDHVPPAKPADIAEYLQAAVDNAAGPSLSGHMLERGTLQEMREFAIHRSAYQLKEADPHTWVIPRLAGDAKAALVAIQADEYGAGTPADVHATLFADTMEALGLDSRYGTYLPLLPGTTLATVNLVSMFGLHRRWRGALVGHLTVFEMTSVTPMGRYAAALRRLGLPPKATRFYDVHVEADAEHQVIALHSMAAALARDEPRLASSIAFGANAVLYVERVFAEQMLASWSAGASSLLPVTVTTAPSRARQFGSVPQARPLSPA